MSTLRVANIENTSGSESIVYDGSTLSFFSGSQQGMVIDSTGKVSMPNQPMFFGCPTNTSGVGTSTSFGGVQNIGMSVSGGRVTLPLTGIYHITFCTICDRTTSRRDAAIRINGSTVVNTLSAYNGDSFAYRGASITRYLNANDYVEFYNADWYNAPATGFDSWRTSSIVFLG